MSAAAVVTASAGRVTVGAQIDPAELLEVAARLLVEGRARLEESPESALVAFSQAFSLEQQYGAGAVNAEATADEVI